MLPGGSWKNIENDRAYTFTEPTNGNYPVEVQVEDNVGNPQSTLVGFMVNLTPSPLPEETETDQQRLNLLNLSQQNLELISGEDYGFTRELQAQLLG